MPRSKLSHLKWLLPLFLAVLLGIFHAVWMAALGDYLVEADQPFHADAAVVLGGDGFGHRILKAADLVRQGYVPKVVVSGPEGMYGFSEAELAIRFAVTRGAPETWFVPAPNKSRSTREEAAALAPYLNNPGVHRYLLVTSDYHTRRAGRMFRAAYPGLEFRVIAAPDQFFRAGSWWRTREGRKCFVLEWLKTFAAWLGI